jgi:hypothetical protein
LNRSWDSSFITVILNKISINYTLGYKTVFLAMLCQKCVKIKYIPDDESEFDRLYTSSGSVEPDGVKDVLTFDFLSFISVEPVFDDELLIGLILGVQLVEGEVVI